MTYVHTRSLFTHKCATSMLIAVSMNLSNSSSVPHSVSELPAATSAFFPAFLTELVVGLVSNGLLLALLVKARSVQSNTNIFLASMLCANALTLVPTTAMMIATVNRAWVLDEGACLTIQMVSTAIQFPNIMLHVFISRDRYKAVLHFFEWKPYTRQTYLYISFVWVLAAALGGAETFSGAAKANDTVHSVVFCQIPHLHRAYDPRSPYSDAWIALFVLTGLIHFGAAVFSIFNYCYILRKILAVKGLQAHQFISPAASGSIVSGNAASRCFDPGLGTPIEWESEVETLKSIFLAFLLNAVAFLSCYAYYTGTLITSIVKGLPFDEVYDPVVLVAIVMLYVLPTVNPAVFLITNTKFRRRIRGLLNWSIQPDTGSTRLDCHVLQVSLAIDQRRSSIPVDKGGHGRNKIVPLSSCKNGEVPKAALHNTWV